MEEKYKLSPADIERNLFIAPQLGMGIWLAGVSTLLKEYYHEGEYVQEDEPRLTRVAWQYYLSPEFVSHGVDRKN